MNGSLVIALYALHVCVYIYMHSRKTLDGIRLFSAAKNVHILRRVFVFAESREITYL